MSPLFTSIVHRLARSEKKNIDHHHRRTSPLFALDRSQSMISPTPRFEKNNLFFSIDDPINTQIEKPLACNPTFLQQMHSNSHQNKMDAYTWGLLPYMFYVPTFKCLSVKSGFDLESYRKFRSSLNLLPNSQFKTVNVFVIKHGPTGFDMVFRGNTKEIKAEGQSLLDG